MKYELSFKKIGMFQRIAHYDPCEKTSKARVAFICIHSNADYSDFPAGSYLAERGYHVLCGQVGNAGGPLNEKLEDIRNAVNAAKRIPGVEKVILIGHSGGATLMSFYQSVAENGPAIYQGEKMIVPLEVRNPEPLPAADGVVLLDSNFGNAVMSAISVDPAIIDETSGVHLNKELDCFESANGFNPEGTRYSEEFKKKFLKAQRERYARLIDKALERYNAIQNHQGNFFDDEPYIIPGAGVIAPNNKLIQQDTSLLNHTEDAYKLIHPDGSITTEVIYSLRKGRGMKSPTPMYGFGAAHETVKSFLTGGAIRLTEDYNIDETHVSGLDLDTSYCCTIGNVRYISCPILVMGMTAGYEFLAAEAIWRNLPGEDKDIAFVEGATHMMMPERGTEEKYGDTADTAFNYVDRWTAQRF